jgi:hypothetical protein
VGASADEAKAVIAREAPGFTIQVLQPGSFATMEWRCNRVRIWLGGSKEAPRVSQPPSIG